MFEAVWSWVAPYWSWFTAWVRVTFGRGSGAAPQDHDWAIYRVYIFNERVLDHQVYYKELPAKAFVPESWEADARNLTGWDAFRVEVRYRVRGRKFRLVLRPGDRLAFPPYDNPRPMCRFPKGVISARLRGPPGSGVDCDVTARVQKYQGPHSDFHGSLGLAVSVQDMFPFDDQDDNSAHFSTLRITNALAQTKDYVYSQNGDVTA